MNPNRSTSATTEHETEIRAADTKMPDADLASKPSPERERLLDAERLDEMNENDDLRVDGKHYASVDQAEAIKESELEDSASAHLGARDEEVDRTQGPPAMGTRPAQGKGERPTPDESH